MRKLSSKTCYAQTGPSSHPGRADGKLTLRLRDDAGPVLVLERDAGQRPRVAAVGGRIAEIGLGAYALQGAATVRWDSFVLRRCAWPSMRFQDI